MTKELVDRMEAARRPFRELAAKMADDGGLEQPTESGWTAKEMLSHVAFWQECCEAVVRGMYRGEVSIDQWNKFGSGYVPEDPWPVDTVHNAREAAWGKQQTPETVLSRWDAAFESAKAILATVTDEEAVKWAEYFDGQVNHLDEHYEELMAAASASTK
jgi:hypothetical protein